MKTKSSSIEPRISPYPEYKISGVKWIDFVPSNWLVKKIKHTTYVKGRIGWQGLRSDEFIDEGPYLVTGTDFVNGYINWESCYHIDFSRYIEDPYIQLKEKDLLITKDGTIGKVAIVKGLPDKACLNSGVFLTRPITKDYITDYLYWVLNSDVFAHFINYTKAGSTIAHLYQNVFETFAFPTPSIDEQRSIASFLDRKTTEIDALIAKKRRMKALLQEKRTAVISHAVTKGLDPNAPMKDSGVEWLGEVPRHWKVKKLKHFGRVMGGYAFSSNDFTSAGVRVIKIANVHQMSFDWSEESFLPEHYLDEFKQYSPMDGAVIFALTRPIISTGIKAAIHRKVDGDFLVNQRVGFFNPSAMLHKKFLHYLVNSISFKDAFFQYITATNQPNISPEDIQNIKFGYPSFDEQHEISNFLDAETSHIDNVASKCIEAIDKLLEYRTALISAAVTGKIDVRNEAA